MNIEELEEQVQRPADPLLPTKEDQAILATTELVKRDPIVRHRRLSQLEQFVARVEQQAATLDAKTGAHCLSMERKGGQSKDCS